MDQQEKRRLENEVKNILNQIDPANRLAREACMLTLDALHRSQQGNLTPRLMGHIDKIVDHLPIRKLLILVSHKLDAYAIKEQRTEIYNAALSLATAIRHLDNKDLAKAVGDNDPELVEAYNKMTAAQFQRHLEEKKGHKPDPLDDPFQDFMSLQAKRMTKSDDRLIRSLGRFILRLVSRLIKKKVNEITKKARLTAKLSRPEKRLKERTTKTQRAQRKTLNLFFVSFVSLWFSLPHLSFNSRLPANGYRNCAAIYRPYRSTTSCAQTMNRGNYIL